MADITWTDVTNHAAQLAKVSTGARADILRHVNESFAAAKFGGEDHPKYKLFRILMAAHFGQIDVEKNGEAAASITSKSISRDSMSVSFASGSTKDGLMTTSYGAQAYAMIIISPAARLPIVP